MRIEESSRHGYRVIRVTEDIVLTSDVGELREHLEKALQKGEKRVALGFTPNSYLYTEAIAVLVQCFELIQDAGGKLAIINPNEDILDVLRIAGFLDLVAVVKTEDELAST